MFCQELKTQLTIDKPYKADKWTFKSHSPYVSHLMMNLIRNGSSENYDNNNHHNSDNSDNNDDVTKMAVITASSSNSNYNLYKWKI